MTKPGVILLLLIALLSVQTSFAQKKKMESYKSLQKRSSASSVTRLLDDANALKLTNPKEALNQVEDALAMSIAQSDDESEGKCYVLIGEINEGIQEWKLALDNYTQAYQKLSGTETTEFKRAVQGLGAMNLKLGNYAESLKFSQQALTLDLTRDERSERLLDVSEVYFQMGRYDEALQTLSEIPASKKICSRLTRESRINRLRIMP